MAQPTPKRINPLVLIVLLSVAFFVVFVAISGALFLNSRSGGGGTSATPALFASGTVGIVELKGAIMESRKPIAQLKNFEDDPSIKAVVLRLDSPGGAVAPSQEIYDVVRNYKKPLVVSMGQLAASGAFYIACGAKRVFANPGTITGSIGVIMQFINLEKLYEWAKVKRFAIKTGKYKDGGADYREMTADERALMQAMIDDVLGQFKKAIQDGRKLKADQVTAIADGRVFSGAQAKQMKLVDDLGGLEDAIKAAGELGQIKGKPRVVYPDRRKRARLMDILLDEGRDEDAESSLSWVAQAARALTGMRDSVPMLPSLQSLVPGVYWLWTGG
jgi:protease-4